ncbi:MAG TPA: ATP-binding protein [Candidatus Polarisedimenticolaceae bacterium]|nr:ATP-binding protein [Candidatus Polarisedimenticolaceae bacterium]
MPVEQLQALGARLPDLLEAAPDAMVVVGEDGRIVLANSEAERLFGYSPEELRGLAVEDLVPDRFRGAHPQHREGYVRDPHRRPMGLGIELYARRKDGREFPAEISLGPVQMEQGRVTIAAIRDVTERAALSERLRRQNEQLSEQNRKIEEASRLKSEFLSNMSHELRTPLHAIIGFAELMHDGKAGPVSAPHGEYLRDILVSSRHLLQLIDDVLDLAKVESGKMEFRPTTIPIRALMEEVRDVVRVLADAKRICLDVDVAPELDAITIDASRLKQILFNFLSNALKFTAESGRVTLRALPEGPDALRFEVEDTGIGVDPADLDRLFVEFQQLDGGTAKRYPGVGLGLALTKRVVEAQGGRVGVVSTPGRGSTFFAILPRSPRGSHGS